MRRDEHLQAYERYKRQPVHLIEGSENMTDDEVMQRLQAMGAIRRVHRDRRKIPLEEILLLIAAVGVAVMVGWGVYLWG